MARYRLTATAYINDGLRAAGDVVEVPDDFVPGPHMEPYKAPDGSEDPAARAAKDAAAERGKLPAPGDPAYVGQLIAHAMRGGDTHGPVASASGGAAEMTRTSVPTAHPQSGALGVIAEGDGTVKGVVAGVADPPQAPFARLPGVPELDMQQAVQDDAAARDGKGPVAEEAAAANSRRRGEKPPPG